MYFPIPCEELNLTYFESDEKMKLLVDSLLLNFDYLPIIQDKKYSSLLIPLFENLNGLTIFNALSSLLFMPNTFLKQRYQLQNNEIFELRNKLNYNTEIQQVENIPQYEQLLVFIEQQIDILQDLKGQAQIKFSQQPSSAQLGQNGMDYLSLIRNGVENYRYKNKQRQSRGEQNNKDRRSESYQEQHMLIRNEYINRQLKEIGVSDSGSDNDDDYMELTENGHHKERTVNQYLMDSKKRTNGFDLNKFRQQYALSPLRQVKRKQERSLIRNDLKKMTKQIEKHSSTIMNFPSHKRLSQWGSILDYTTGKEVSGQGVNRTISGFARHNYDNVPLDSMFFKKQTLQPKIDSQFQKKKPSYQYDQIQRKIRKFNYREQRQKFKEDKFYKHFVTQQMQRIQVQLHHGQFYSDDLLRQQKINVDGVEYNVQDPNSLNKSLTQYLEGISALFSNEKEQKNLSLINSVCSKFGILWALVTNKMHNSSDSNKESVFSGFERQIFDYMKKFSFEEYLDNHLFLILQLFMILDFLKQINILSSEIIQFVQYCYCWILKSLIEIDLDIQRGLMRKDLRDNLILMQILGKVSSGSYSQIVQSSMSSLFDSLFMNNDQNTTNDYSFVRWTQTKAFGISPDFCHQSKALELSLYSYQVFLLLSDLNSSVFNSQSYQIDWSIIVQLVDRHSSLSLNPIDKQLCSILQQMVVDNSTNLTQEQFISIYTNIQLSLKGNQGNQLKKESLLQLTGSLFNENQDKRTHDLLEAYLQNLDQKQIKQLYSKFTSKVKDQNVLFELQTTFGGAIDNDQQKLLIFKKNLSLVILCLKSNPDQAGFPLQMAQMLIRVIHSLSKIRGGSNCDLTEIIDTLNTSLDSFVDLYIHKVIQQKNNLNYNQFIMKNEEYLLSMSQVFKSLYSYSKVIKGKWINAEFRWFNSSLLQKLTGIYNQLAAKPQDLEQSLIYYFKFLLNILSKRRYTRSITPQQNYTLYDDQQISSSFGKIETDSFDECSEGLLAECLSFEESDNSLCKYLAKVNIQGSLEAFITSYLKIGKDYNVLLNVYKLSGRIDGVQMDNQNLKSISLIQKLSANKFPDVMPVSQTIDSKNKPMMIADMICAYLRGVFYKCGTMGNVSGKQALTQTSYTTKNENNQMASLIIQLNLIILENLVRGISKKQEQNRIPQGMKLYSLFQAQQSKDFILHDQIETDIFKVLVSLDIKNISYKQNNYSVQKQIFSNFFQKLVDNFYSIQNKRLYCDTICKYIAIVPPLYSEHISKHSSRDSYADFLKGLMLSIMVNFQLISTESNNLSKLISQVVEILMPTVFQGVNHTKFQTSQFLSQDISLSDSIQSNEAFYFYQYLALQYGQFESNRQIQVGNPKNNVSSNMFHLLNLMTSKIELNLSPIIQNIIISKEKTIVERLKYLKLSEDNIKELLDQMSAHPQFNGFLKDFLKRGGSLYFNVVQQPYSLIKSQRKVLCLLFLHTLLISRFYEDKNSNSLIYGHSSHILNEVVDSLNEISDQLLEQVTSIEISSFENNLNVLAYLQCMILAKKVSHRIHLKRVSLFICEALWQLILFNFDIGEKQINGLNDQRRQSLIQLMREQFKQIQSMTGEHYDFLMKSAHEFEINDKNGNYMLSMILNCSFQLLQSAFKDETKNEFKDLLKSYLITLLNIISSNEKQNVNASEKSKWIIITIKKGIKSLAEVDTFQLRPKEFKNIHQLYC